MRRPKILDTIKHVSQGKDPYYVVRGSKRPPIFSRIRKVRRCKKLGICK